MKTFLQTLNLRRASLLVLGDFNISMHDLGLKPETDFLFDTLASFDTFPCASFPTRICTVNGQLKMSTIDNIFVHPKHNPDCFGIMTEQSISDHIPVVMDVFGKEKRQPLEKKEICTAKKTHYDQLERAFASERWLFLYQETDANQVGATFEEVKDNYIRKHLPFKTISFRPSECKPWFTKGLNKSRIALSKLRKKSLKTPTLLSEYKSKKNLYNRLIRRAEKAYTFAQLKQHKHDSKRTWQILNNVINRKTKRGNPLAKHFSINGIITTDKEVIANAFNLQYATMGPKMAKSFNSDEESNIEKYLNPFQGDRFELHTVKPRDVHEVIKSLKNKKSSGRDLMTNCILKQSSYSLVFPLTYLVNQSIKQKIFPNCWQVSKIIPVFKGGNQLDTLQYRPVSLSPVASKILEKIVARQIYTFIEKTQQMSDTQFGFRAKNRCSHLTSTLINKITKALASGKKILVTYIDFSKAFDTVSFNLFLRKLKYIGFSEGTIQWFYSYLHGRQQFCEFHGVKSSMRPVVCGIPQGTVLGPLVFLLYTMDVGRTIKSDVLSFADDTTIVTIADSLSDLQNVAQADYNILSDWYFQSQLTLNGGKTKYMLFGCKTQDKLDLQIQGSSIKRVSEYKLVGTIIDDKLTWKAHIDRVRTKLGGVYGMISKAKRNLTIAAKKLLYNSLARSYITYGLENYGSAKATSLKPIATLQKKCIRAVFGLEYNETTVPSCMDNRILYLEDEIILSRIMLAKSILEPYAPGNIQKIYNREEHGVTRASQRLNLVVPKFKTTLLQESSTYQVPFLWNQLHDTAQKLKTKPLVNFIKTQLTNLYS